MLEKKQHTHTHIYIDVEYIINLMLNNENKI